MSRVLYYSGYRMSVFQWAGDVLIDSYSFLPDEEGLKEFRYYFINSSQEPVRILLDVIEEDYFKETIPHVSKKDRISILSRRLLRNYPKSENWFYSRVLGRENRGRKDDQVVYSVITNPDILLPWLEILEGTKTAVSGIWSLSLLSSKLLSKMSIDDKNCLLVSQQVPSNIRQSFFIDGELQTSRSGVVNLQEMNISEHINREVNQTSSFLANQRYIDFDEVLNIHVICPAKEISLMEKNLENTPLKQYHFHSLEKYIHEFSVENITSQYANGIFSKLCKEQKFSIGQYSSHKLLRFYYQKLLSKTLYISSAAIFLVSCVIGLYIQSDINVLDADIQLSEQQIESIENGYKKEFTPIQSQLDQAVGMKSAIEFSKKLSLSKKVSPQRSLRYISNLISRSGMSDIQITNISWHKTQSKKVNKISAKKEAELKYSSADEYYNQIKILGYLGSENDSVEILASKVDRLKAVLERDKNILDLKLNRLPLDLRSDSKVERITSTVALGAVEAKRKNQFEIQLLIKAG